MSPDLNRSGWRSHFFRWQMIWEFPTVLLIYLSFCLPVGLAAACCVLPWLIWVATMAFQGLLLVLERWRYPEELSLAMALIFLPVGAIWLFASRLGLNFMGFPPVIVILTAVHFHFAGFASCLVLGASGRLILPLLTVKRRVVYYGILFSALIGIPLLALGILAFPWLEGLSAFVFAVSLWCWALMVLVVLLPRQSGWVWLLLLGSVGSIFWSMAWALRFALGTYLGLNWVGIPAMAGLHGAVNAFGFASLGLLALGLLRPQPRKHFAAIPFSRLWSRGVVGSQFFHKQGLVAAPVEHAPTGLIDRFEDFSRPDFDVSDLPENLRQFYVHTRDYALRVTPEWQPGFVLLGRLFRRLMNGLGQMALPIEVEGFDDFIDSQILPLHSQQDGRQNVRAWVRTYAKTGQTVYAAAYSQHKQVDQIYMNIAFPLPGGHLTSILRLDWFQKTLSLSSLPYHKVMAKLGQFEQNPQSSCDQGVYLSCAGVHMRLPINESIYVWDRRDQSQWPVDCPAGTTVLARHDMWLMGLLCLRLYYAIYPQLDV